MAMITSVTRLYAKAVFLDRTRELDSVPASQQAGVKEHAAFTYYIEDIQAALDAGTITEAQYDEVFALNPNMKNRPVYTAANVAAQVIE